MQDKLTGFLHCSTAHNLAAEIGQVCHRTMSKSGIPGFKGLVFIPLGGACRHNNVTSRLGQNRRAPTTELSILGLAMKLCQMMLHGYAS